MPKVVTANLLTTGAVVFLGEDETWVDRIDAAKRFADTASAESGLATGLRDVGHAIVVDPFLAETGPGGSGMTLRDSIRAFGPTIDYLPAGTDRART